jgi:EAL domain-containing protein (putative c-di-GMP-specific phosphodiesterase class I)
MAGEWVLREACRQSALWQAQGLELLVAVNISARQFQAPAFFDTVLQAIADAGIAPSAIELEITESLIMQDPESVAGDLLSKPLPVAEATAFLPGRL